MIQDIAPLHLQNVYEMRSPKASDKIIGFHEQEILIKNTDLLDFMTYEEMEKYFADDLPCFVYLFSIGDDQYFLAGLPENIGIEGFTYCNMAQIKEKRPMEKVLAAATALHLYVWYRDNQFCGRCGNKLIHSKKERMLECPICKNMVYPKIAPAVIVGVMNGDKLLMSVYAGRTNKRRALIAGFTEIGETAEETVQREVMEEVGLHVKNIQYYKSQPWGFAGNLLLGFYCELDGSPEITLDQNELAEAEWICYREIDENQSKLSLTSDMMLHFKKVKMNETKEE